VGPLGIDRHNGDGPMRFCQAAASLRWSPKCLERQHRHFLLGQRFEEQALATACGNPLPLMSVRTFFNDLASANTRRRPQQLSRRASPRRSARRRRGPQGLLGVRRRPLRATPRWTASFASGANDSIQMRTSAGIRRGADGFQWALFRRPPARRPAEPGGPETGAQARGYGAECRVGLLGGWTPQRDRCTIDARPPVRPR